MRYTLGLVFSLFSCLVWSDTLPLEQFVRHGDYLDMTISPDGNHLLARADIKGRIALLFLDSKTGKVVGGVQPGDKNIIHSAQWINNERVVYQFAEKLFYSDKPIPTGELFAVNIDGSKRKLLFGYRAGNKQTGSNLSSQKSSFASLEILNLLPEEEKKILIIEYPWSQKGRTYYDDREKIPTISKLDVYSGRKKKIESLTHNHSYALANDKGVVNFMGWRDQQGNSHTAYRKANKTAWQELNSIFKIDSNTLPISLNNAGDKVYLSGRTGDNNVFSVYELDLVSGQYEPVFGDHDTDIEDWIIDHQTNEPVVGISYPNTHQYHYASSTTQLAKLHKSLNNAFGGQQVKITSSSQNGHKHLVHVSSDTNPGEYYIFDSTEGKAQFVWANRSWIDPRTMVPKEPFSILSRDNVRLHGYITYPQMTANEQVPMVVLIHGGPRARDFPNFDSEVQLLANRGFAVLQVNFRGSDGYGSNFLDQGNREWGNKIINDIVDATKWAINSGKIKQDKICTYGASFGGYAALMAVVKETEMYQCTVGYVGIYDLEYMYTESDIPDNWGGQAYLQSVLGNDKAQLKAYSPVHNVDKINVPVLLIHGDKDRRVPVVNAKVMEKALQTAGKEVSTLRYSLSGHGVYDVKSRTQLYEGLLHFFEQHIGP